MKVSDGVDMRYNGEIEVARHISNHCKSFADVGANIGEWTTIMLKHCSSNITGHAFEPNPSYNEQLTRNLQASGITVHSTALSDSIKDHSFVLDGRSSRIQASKKEGEQIQLKTDTLDNIFSDQTIDFIKIDCEGHDFKVIHGAKDMIIEKRTKYIQFEYNSLWLEHGSSLLQAITFLENNDFDVFRIHKRGLKRICYKHFGDYYRYSNFLAVNREYLHNIEGLLLS